MLLTIAVVRSIYIKMKYSISLAQNSTLVAIFFNSGRTSCTPGTLVTGYSVTELLCVHSIQKLQPNWEKKIPSNISDSSFHFTRFLMKKTSDK